jgi:hypothetical protein
MLYIHICTGICFTNIWFTLYFTYTAHIYLGICINSIWIHICISCVLCVCVCLCAQVILKNLATLSQAHYQMQRKQLSTDFSISNSFHPNWQLEKTVCLVTYLWYSYSLWSLLSQTLSQLHNIPITNILFCNTDNDSAFPIESWLMQSCQYNQDFHVLNHGNSKIWKPYTKVYMQNHIYIW